MSDETTRTEAENAIYDEALAAGKAEAETTIMARIEVATAEVLGTMTAERDTLKEQLDALTLAHTEATAKLTDATARVGTLEAGLKFKATGSGDESPKPGEDEPTTFPEAIAMALVAGKNQEQAQIHCQRAYPALHQAYIGFDGIDKAHRG